jgi:hypothetical protein
MTSKQTQIAAMPGQVAPAWAVTLIADMHARKASAPAPVLSAGLQAAADRARSHQQTKGHGSAYGAAKFTAAW